MSNRKSKADVMWDRVKEESELIAIFVVFLVVLIAHETLIEIHEKASFRDVLKAWVVLLGATLVFFVFVFRVAIKQLQRAIGKTIEDRLGPISTKLGFAVKNIEVGTIQKAFEDKRFLLAESDVMQLEATVTSVVWVVSPDFRFELGDSHEANYLEVIADNIAKGVKYNYFVPFDGTTATKVKRFEHALTLKLQAAAQPTQASLEKVTIVALPWERYPATAIFGCALYEIDEDQLAFIEYFPSGGPQWNIVFRDGRNSLSSSASSAQMTPSTESNGAIMLKSRFERLLEASTKVSVNGSLGVRYFQNAS